MTRRWTARWGALLAGLVIAVGLGQAAWAAGGQSTPGVTVTAQNPGTSSQGANLRITLTAHSAASTVPNPSCRPQDRNIECWGDLVLRVPEGDPVAGGLTLKGLEVHRVAVGDITCGDDNCGDDGGDCGDSGDCGGGGMTAAPTPGAYPVDAQVNGLSTITVPGAAMCLPAGATSPDTPKVRCPVGTQVQVKVTLTDNGTAQYGDTASVQVNQFIPGPVKPTIWQSGTQTIQQVQIHVDNG